ncbi:MAG: hypothetical protein ACAH83_19580 [Alphaproteobacteria bacterium]
MKNSVRRLIIPLLAIGFIAGAAGFAFAAHMGALPALRTQALPVLFGFGDDKPAAQAQAQVHEIHDDATFAKKTKAYSMMPYNKADLEFELYLPAEWTAEDTVVSTSGEVGARITGPVAIFRSPMIGTQFATATVEVLKLDFEVSARNWLKNHLTTSGFLPQGDVTEINNRSSAGAYITSSDGASKYCYIAARISGSFVVIARFESPLNLRGYLQYLQKKSIDSFKLLYPKEDSIEEQKVFTLVDSIKFNYPASWKVSNPDFRDMNRLIVELRNLKPGTEGRWAITQGYIRLLAIRRQRVTDLMTEIDNMRKYFTETMSLEFKKMLSTGKSDAYGRFVFNRYEVYDVISKAAKIPTTQEIHLVVLGDKEWYIFAFLFTPKETNELAMWGRNVQSFQEVIKSIK